jgi:hypothetical protein
MHATKVVLVLLFFLVTMVLLVGGAEREGALTGSALEGKCPKGLAWVDFPSDLYTRIAEPVGPEEAAVKERGVGEGPTMRVEGISETKRSEEDTAAELPSAAAPVGIDFLEFTLGSLAGMAMDVKGGGHLQSAAGPIAPDTTEEFRSAEGKVLMDGVGVGIGEGILIGIAGGGAAIGTSDYEGGAGFPTSRRARIDTGRGVLGEGSGREE